MFEKLHVVSGCAMLCSMDRWTTSTMIDRSRDGRFARVQDWHVRCLACYSGMCMSAATAQVMVQTHCFGGLVCPAFTRVVIIAANAPSESGKEST